MPLSSWAWGAGRVHDILVWDSDAVWRARGTNHPPTFSGSAAVSMVCRRVQYAAGYLPAMVFPNEDAELGVTDGAQCNLGIWLPSWQDQI